MIATRTRDPMIGLGHLAKTTLVECPRCGQAASVERVGLLQARLTCTACGLAARDPGAWIAARATRVWITRLVPRCDRCGRPVTERYHRPANRHGGKLVAQTRCPGCGHITIFPAAASWGAGDEGRDPYFGLPLYLTERVGPHLLWAYNRAHIAALRTWLGASLRERPLGESRMTMMARLPRWMKAAGARHRVLRALDRLDGRAQKALACGERA